MTRGIQTAGTGDQPVEVDDAVVAAKIRACVAGLNRWAAVAADRGIEVAIEDGSNIVVIAGRGVIIPRRHFEVVVQKRIGL